jgi:hypothetical protein
MRAARSDEGFLPLFVFFYPIDLTGEWKHGILIPPVKQETEEKKDEHKQNRAVFADSRHSFALFSTKDQALV